MTDSIAAADASSLNEDITTVGELFRPLVEAVPTPILVLGGVGIIVAVLVASESGRKVLKRFALGLPLDGELRTNARAFKPATKVVGDWGGPGREVVSWHYLPYAKRAAVRWIVLLVILGVITGAITNLVATVILVTLAVVTVVAVRTRRKWAPRAADVARTSYTRMRNRGALAIEAGDQSLALEAPDPDDVVELPARDLESEIRRPIWDGVQLVLELPISDDPAKWIELPKSVDVDDAQVTVRLPRKWQGWPEQRKVLDHAVKTRLPGDWDATYTLYGAWHSVTYRRIPRPPKRVTIGEVRETVEKSPEEAPVFAVGPRFRPVTSSFDDESPHILLSMGSGAGKSVTVKSIVARPMHKGAIVYIADIKRTSHPWARGLPNAHIAKDVNDIHDLLVFVAEEAHSRQYVLDDDPDADVGPRIILVVEELNMLGPKLKLHWEKIKGKGDPKLSPALESLGDISYAGRNVKVHLLLIGQKVEAQILGPQGASIRENAATRILGRYTENNWKMLVPEVKPMPSSSKIRGRVQVVMAGEATESQIVYWDDKELRDYVTSGSVSQCPVPPTSATVVPDATSGESQSVVDAPEALGQEEETPERPALRVVRPLSALYEADPITEVTMAEARDMGIIADSEYERARKALQRDQKAGKGPEPVSRDGHPKYDADDLAEWWQSKRAN